ncbi:hypothetical protein NST23_24600 [Brevibacillus sp. FSL K6-0770]|uniref:hypothetical protein n=1 Tax=Brevibacillus sp. FSL K6-0770 TaxID=2954673 RepID=UPI0030F4F050
MKPGLQEVKLPIIRIDSSPGKGIWVENSVSGAQLKLRDDSKLEYDGVDVISPDYKVRRSAKDANGKYTQVDYLRPADNTLAIRTALIGAVDSNGNYPTMRVIKYKADGVTVISTVDNPITYDVDGDYINCG